MTTVTRYSRRILKDSSDEITSPPGRSRRLASLRNHFLTPKVHSKEVKVLSDSEDEGYNTHKTLSTPKKNKSKMVTDDCSASPPKQRKSENISESPSALIQKLSVSSGRGKRVKQKSLFKEDDTSTENGEKVPLVKDVKTVYLNARKALHSAPPTELPGREVELENLRKFIQEHLDEKSSGSLYISGPPGTGKTASLNIILGEKHIVNQLHHVYVNCTSLKSPTAVFSHIADELRIKSSKSEKEYLSNIESYLTNKRRKMTLLILDEIDQLENKNHSTLYTIFEWPSKFTSQIILIGIANALDLTDRILPRLQARCELKPALMHFAPYTKHQISQIITSRLRSADVSDVFSPATIQILAGKVAAVSGDIRRALDIGRRVIELADQNNRNGTLKSIENIADNIVEKEMKSIELKEVVNVINNIYGTSQSLADDDENTFPLQQKLVLCSLIIILRKAKNKDVTIGRLYDVYRKMCVNQHIATVDQSEFAGLCSLIETRGIVRVTGKKEMKLRKINLEWDEEEVFTAMKDKQLISRVLHDTSCLGL